MSCVKDEKRLSFLDGMRGIAIISVMLFHAYVRWIDLYPYADRFVNFPLFKYGWFGVELFFLISGFVILMTLEKCSSFMDFILRRWFRLFPAMFVCSLFVFLSSFFFYERPLGIPGYLDILPGLMFIEPEYLVGLTNQSLVSLEGAFWSLYTEVKFYFLFGFVYFISGGRLAILSLVFLFFITCCVTYFPNHVPYSAIVKLVAVHADAEYFGWFASGAMFYEFYKSRELYILVIAIVVGMASAFLFKGVSIRYGVIGSLVVLFFAAPLVSCFVASLLSNKLLLFIGFISYPLYLLHENIMVSLIIKIGDCFSSLDGLALPLLAMFFVVSLAAVFAYYLEPLTKKLLNPFYKFVRDSVVLDKKIYKI